MVVLDFDDECRIGVEIAEDNLDYGFHPNSHGIATVSTQIAIDQEFIRISQHISIINHSLTLIVLLQAIYIGSTR